MYLELHNTERRYAGGFYIIFKSPPLFRVPFCGHLINFPTTLPSETDKVWRITQTRNSGVIGLTVHCNDVEVVNVVISNTTCGDIRWSWYYTRDREMIKFHKVDTASDYYRAAPSKCHIISSFLNRSLLKLMKCEN